MYNNKLTFQGTNFTPKADEIRESLRELYSEVKKINGGRDLHPQEWAGILSCIINCSIS